MAAASRCDVCGLCLWSPATRCEGCSAQQARLGTPHLASGHVACGGDGSVSYFGDGGCPGGDRRWGWRARPCSQPSRSRSPHSESSSEAPGPSRPGAPPPAERGPPAEAERPRPRPMERSRPNKGAGRGGGKGGGEHSTAPTRARRGGRRHPARTMTCTGASHPPARVMLHVSAMALLHQVPGCG